MARFPEPIFFRERPIRATPVARYPVGRRALWLTATLALMPIVGCGGAISNPASSTSQPASLTGNWQIAATTTSGIQPFSALSGSILQEAAQGTGSSSVVGVLQAWNPSSCYLGETTEPMWGSFAGASLSLLSFSVTEQYLSMNVTSSSDDDQIEGSFSIAGGCANGITGTLSGTKIPALSGVYTGVWEPGGSPLTLTLTQSPNADGLGYFHLQGSAVFGGISCFTGGTVQNDASVISGQQVSLTINTNESSPSTVVISGTLSPSAVNLAVSSMAVTSGSCSGTTGTATLSNSAGQ